MIRLQKESNRDDFGNHNSPQSLADLIVALSCDIFENENIEINDQAVESGNLLRSVGNNSKKARLFGNDVSQEALMFAKMNFVVHGVHNYNLSFGDIFEFDPTKENKYDLVVSQPPFLIRNRLSLKSSEDIFPTTSTAESAIILHILKSLKNGGIAFVVTPVVSGLVRNTEDGENCLLKIVSYRL